jgi:hypothetical protein
MALLVHLTKPKHLTDAGREHAERAEGMDMNPSQGLPQSLSERAKDSRAWHRVGTSYVAEWRMVYKELIVGFLVAGAVAALVPASFFQALFPGEGGPWWALPVQAALAPVLAVLTFIGSMGNGPMAAILASHGVVFGAIMAFLYADFVVPPAVKINANYYGWKFAGYLAAVFAAAAVIAGIAVHLLFAVVGLLPRGGRNVAEMATFAIDYTFWLNLLALAVAGALVVLFRRKPAPAKETAERARAGTRVIATEIEAWTGGLAALAELVSSSAAGRWAPSSRPPSRPSATARAGRSWCALVVAPCQPPPWLRSCPSRARRSPGISTCCAPAWWTPSATAARCASVPSARGSVP